MRADKISLECNDTLYYVVIFGVTAIGVIASRQGSVLQGPCGVASGVTELNIQMMI